jgi:hypothetical protein
MTRGDIGARGGGERGRLRARHYLVGVVNNEREVGERTETLEAAFIGVVGVDRTVVHLFFHEGKAADLGGDGGDSLKGCLKAFTDVAR